MTSEEIKKLQDENQRLKEENNQLKAHFENSTLLIRYIIEEVGGQVTISKNTMGNMSLDKQLTTSSDGKGNITIFSSEI